MDLKSIKFFNDLHFKNFSYFWLKRSNKLNIQKSLSKLAKFREPIDYRNVLSTNLFEDAGYIAYFGKLNFISRDFFNIEIISIFKHIRKNFLNFTFLILNFPLYRRKLRMVNFDLYFDDWNNI